MSGSLCGLRVAVDGRYLGRPGMGIHSYLRAALSLLEGAGAELTLLLDHRTLLPPGYEQLPQVRLAAPLPRVWEQVALARYLASDRRHEVYFAPGNTGIPLGCPKGRRRFVVAVHDLIPLHLFRQYARWPLCFLGYCGSIAVSVRRADAVLVHTSAVAAEVRALFRRPAVLTSLPLRQMLGGWQAAPQAPAAAARRAPYLLYNGGADPRKNLAALLRGFAAARAGRPELELVVLGNGYGAHRAQADREGLGGVEFLGYVDEEDKRALIGGAAGLVYPSSLEGFGLPVVEGLLGGTLVLCSDIPVLREVGGDAPLYLSSLDPAGIGAGLEGLLGLGPAERAARLEAGRAQAERLLGSFDTGAFLAAFAGEPR